MQKNQWKTEICDDLLFSLGVILASLFGELEKFFLSGGILILLGLLLAVLSFRREKSILCPIGILSLSWVMCLGISSLKLSRLQSVWEGKTWICFVIFYLIFRITYKIVKDRKLRVPELESRDIPEHDIRFVIYALTAVSCFCFLLEAWLLSYVPLFTVDTPHAYSYFHISGVHYFTVSCVLVPGLSYLYLEKTKGQITREKALSVILCIILSLLLPILMVSRYQLIFACMLTALCFLMRHAKDLTRYFTKKNLGLFGISLFALLGLYLFLTVERAHSVSYLNGIFEMKNENMPIFITQPYIYIANNFDNFNCMVRDLTKHSYGLKGLFPAFALSGLKFVFPDLLSFPLFVTKEELTTVTILYDAFYDFGIFGVVLFGIFLGVLMALTEGTAECTKSPVRILICAQIYGYLFLAFFTTWYSNPTTWFYLIISIAIEVFLWYINERITRKKGWKHND